MGEVASQKNHIAWTIITHVVADDPLTVAGLDPCQLQLGVIVPVESIERLDATRATKRMVSRLGDLLDSGSHGSPNDILLHFDARGTCINCAEAQGASILVDRIGDAVRPEAIGSLGSALRSCGIA